MSVVPSDLIEIFRTAGWHPRRKVAVDASVTVGHPAYAILAELSALHLMRQYDRYEICEVDFKFLPEKDDLPRQWETVLGTELVGIAEYHNAHGELYIGDAGHVFGNSIIHPAFWYVGCNFAEAMNSIMEGRFGRPMLLDWQTSITLYGREFTHADPEVLRQSSPEIR